MRGKVLYCKSMVDSFWIYEKTSRLFQSFRDYFYHGPMIKELLPKIQKFFEVGVTLWVQYFMPCCAFCEYLLSTSTWVCDQPKSVIEKPQKQHVWYFSTKDWKYEKLGRWWKSSNWWKFNKWCSWYDDHGFIIEFYTFSVYVSAYGRTYWLSDFTWSKCFGKYFQECLDNSTVNTNQNWTWM